MPLDADRAPAGRLRGSLCDPAADHARRHRHRGHAVLLPPRRVQGAAADRVLGPGGARAAGAAVAAVHARLSDADRLGRAHGRPAAGAGPRGRAAGHVPGLARRDDPVRRALQRREHAVGGAAADADGMRAVPARRRQGHDRGRVCRVALTIACNVLRASSLFYVEAGFVPQAAPWWHDGIGIAAFMLSAAVTLWLLGRLRDREADAHAAT